MVPSKTEAPPGAAAVRAAAPHPSAALTAAAFLLVLVNPLIVFLRYNTYGLLSGEALVLYAGVAAIAAVLTVLSVRWPVLRPLLLTCGLIVLLDVQMDPFSRVRWLLLAVAAIWGALTLLRGREVPLLAAVMATMLATTIVEGTARAGHDVDTVPAARQDLPLIVHLVLDEHIGIEGFPPEVADVSRDLRRGFESEGFQLFGGTYSQHRRTHISLSHLFNFEYDTRNERLVSQSTYGYAWQVTSNAYLQTLMKRGYRVRVYQTDYLNLCPPSLHGDLECYTYRYTSAKALRRTNGSLDDRVRLLAGLYMARVKTIDKLQGVYADAREAVESTGVVLPAFYNIAPSVASISTEDLLADLRTDVSQAKPGEMFLAHLLVPHYPYAYTANCEIRPVEAWLSLDQPNPPSGLQRTAEGRLVRYEAYSEQVRCAQQRVREILAAIPPELRDRAVVLIHGDHGSRLAEHDIAGNRSAITDTDLVDSYSTLFAVKLPGVQATYDPRPAVLPCLLESLVKNDFRAPPRLEACNSMPTAFVQTQSGTIVMLPLPFGPS